MSMLVKKELLNCLVLSSAELGLVVGSRRGLVCYGTESGGQMTHLDG